MVKDSVDKGLIAKSRYDNYIQMLEDDNQSYRIYNFESI
jgi:putative ribosome biogenesis GTPase RsgA